MSQENVEIVRQWLETFLATGTPVWDTLDKDVEIEDHDIPEQGKYRGHEGFLRWIEEWDAPWAEWSLQPEEFIDAGDRVVVIVHLKATGRSSGAQVERDDALVFELRDGKMVRIDYFNDRTQALEAAGLSE
jgi:ketosteroid isomerase-like protein